MWADGDRAFYELNDLLQYLGPFAFRAPVPGVPPRRGDVPRAARAGRSPTRRRRARRAGPESDRAVLADILDAAGGVAVTYIAQVKRLDTAEAFRAHARRTRRRPSRSTTRSTRTERSRSPFDDHATAAPATLSVAATGSPCCRWRAGTAPPTGGRPISCGGDGGASARAAAARLGRGDGGAPRRARQSAPARDRRDAPSTTIARACERCWRRAQIGRACS